MGEVQLARKCVWKAREIESMVHARNLEGRLYFGGGGVVVRTFGKDRTDCWGGEVGRYHNI